MCRHPPLPPYREGKGPTRRDPWLQRSKKRPRRLTILKCKSRLMDTMVTFDQDQEKVLLLDNIIKYYLINTNGTSCNDNYIVIFKLHKHSYFNQDYWQHKSEFWLCKKTKMRYYMQDHWLWLCLCLSIECGPIKINSLPSY